jgi:D-alanine-D-alanine ligase
VPKHFEFAKDDFRADRCRLLGWPVVIKPQFEGSSIGLSVAEGEGALLEAAKKAFAYGDRILVEEYISGRELTVGVLGDRALPVVEIVTRLGIYDYEAKYKDPETKYLVPAPIDDKAASSAGRLGLLSHKSLGCRSFSRVDMMMDSSGNIFVLEVNTIPGMTERSLLPKAAKAAGINFTDLCVKLLEDAVSASRSRVRA